MTFARVYSAQTVGIGAEIVRIETDLSRGLYSFSVVGLPGKAVEESRDRVGAAIKNSGFTSPKQRNQKIVVSLAPADIKKEGPLFDLGIGLSYLLSSGNIHFSPENKLFIGELSLSGELQPVKGVLPIIAKAQKEGFTEVYVPAKNADEAALIKNIRVFAVDSLSSIVSHLHCKNNEQKENSINIESINLSPHKRNTDTISEKQKAAPLVDLKDIKGQETAKRALEIAAAGRHNIAFFGPPGTGKTMLARALSGILPDLYFPQALEVTGIHSVAGKLTEHLLEAPPFRSPHHTASYVSLVGGGTYPKPGEITLAHHGVLFLDEFPEFDKRVIEALRQPLEERIISISRAKGSETFPANFILIAALNPCPCGNYGAEGKECICTATQISTYSKKISGPIVDRIDMWVEVGKVDIEKLSDKEDNLTTSDHIKERVSQARYIQNERFSDVETIGMTNSDMTAKNIRAKAHISDEALEVLKQSAQKLDISARSYHRIIKISRTIADLGKKDRIEPEHVLEAISYRQKNREL